MEPFPPWRYVNMNNSDWWRTIDMDNRVAAENFLYQLSEDVLLDVLAKLETKQSMFLCSQVVNQMYANTWMRVPVVCFNSHSHPTLDDFDEHVNYVLTQRGSSEVKTLVYHRCGKESKTNECLLTRMLQYAFDRGVENIWINLKAVNGRSTKVTFPTFILECETLKVLHLDYCSIKNLKHSKLGKSSLIEGLHVSNLLTRTVAPLSYRKFMLPFSIISHPFGLSFNNLTSLSIEKVGLKCGENETVTPFGHMVNLENLTISRALFRSHRPKEFIISAPNLCNLRLALNKFGCKVKVVGRKLKEMKLLFRLTWIKLDLNYISMEEGLIISTDEPETTLNEYGLLRVTWSQEEGQAVDISCNKFEVDDANTDLLLSAENLPSSHTMNYKCIEGGEQSIIV